MSQSELGDMEYTASTMPQLDGTNSPPPPEPPRPMNVSSATMRSPEAPRPITSATMQTPMPQAPPPVPVATSSAVAPAPPVNPASWTAAQVPVATAPAVAAGLPVNPAARMAAQVASDEKERAMWRQGSILEIYSASAGHWYPALVLRVQRGDGAPDVLTMQFWLSTDDAKQKSLYRSDCQHLSPLGANLGGELPPGFSLKPSQSRPGQSVYQDLTTGMKYQTAELAWQTHFQRLLERPASGGMETVAHLPGQASFQVNQQGANGPAAGIVTEYGKEAESGCGMQAMPNQKQAAMVAEGLVTEHGPALRSQGKPGPRTPQAQRQHFHGNSPVAPEQRQQQHGSQLAAELSGRPQCSTGQQPVHQHAQHPAQPQVMDCRRAGASGPSAGYAPANGRAPIGVSC